MNKGPDNLTLCSIAAQRAGMSYGKFIAIGGYSKVAKQADEQKPEVPTRICMHCGKVLSMEGRSHLSKYCSPECQRKASAGRALARYYASKAIPKAGV